MSAAATLNTRPSTLHPMTDPHPLGVFTSIDAGFGVPLEFARELSIPSVHVHAPHAETRSDELADRFLAECQDAGITITVVFMGFEGETYESIARTAETVGLVPRAERAARAAEAREMAAFGRRVGCPVMGMHIGFVPHDRDGEDYRDLVAVTQSLLDDLASEGQRVHLETGQESAEHLLRFFEDVGRENLGVNFDPANMILYGTGDPIEALSKLGPHVGSIHCKDAVAADESVRGSEWGREVAIGTGQVDFRAYFETLKSFGYEGPLTIERELPGDPDRQRADIRSAVEHLRAARSAVWG